MENTQIITLIANYNYGHYIANAIDSALNQTVSNHIVVVDDCSTDNSQQVIADYFTSNPKTTHYEIGTVYNSDRVSAVFLNKNGGPSRSRNIGINLFHADYYQILDADDVMYPNKIERLLSQSGNGVGGVYADYDILDDTKSFAIREWKEPYSLNRLKQSCIIHSGTLINAEALKKVGLYREDMRVAEDYNLWVRMAKAGFIFRHIPESLTLVRTHMNNSTNSVPKEIWEKCWRQVWQ